jgi:F-type H+-transporting ATPase subunit delta
MQTSERVLAGRYARAFFLAAEAAGTYERVQKDLADSHRALLDALPLLRNPRVSGADKKKKLQELLGAKVAPLTLKFLGMLVDKKRYELLPLVGVNLARLVNEKKNVAKAQVRAARPMTAEAQEALKKRLKDFSGKTVELEIREDAELIGGVVVRLGDWVLDGSLRGQLRRIKEKISDGN